MHGGVEPFDGMPSSAHPRLPVRKKLTPRRKRYARSTAACCASAAVGALNARTIFQAPAPGAVGVPVGVPPRRPRLRLAQSSDHHNMRRDSARVHGKRVRASEGRCSPVHASISDERG